jgi:hypothetical protein
MIAAPYQWKEDVAYALSIGLDRPADPTKGIGWHVLSGRRLSRFGKVWHHHKQEMKAAGWRVRKSDAGDWLISFQPDYERNPA